ncbi:hypothetical protein PCE1_004533 [Barthelona sp. PCE]
MNNAMEMLENQLRKSQMKTNAMAHMALSSPPPYVDTEPPLKDPESPTKQEIVELRSKFDNLFNRANTHIEEMRRTLLEAPTPTKLEIQPEISPEVKAFSDVAEFDSEFEDVDIIGLSERLTDMSDVSLSDFDLNESDISDVSLNSTCQDLTEILAHSPKKKRKKNKVDVKLRAPRVVVDDPIVKRPKKKKKKKRKALNPKISINSSLKNLTASQRYEIEQLKKENTKN